MLRTLNRIFNNAAPNKLRLDHRNYTVAGKCLVNSEKRSSISFRKVNFPKRYISKAADQKNTKLSEIIAKKYREMEANLKWRTDPVITTLDTPQFKSILRKNIIDLVAVFQKYGYEIRIAGGAVRDLLMNITPHDIDFATTATPKQMIEMFEKENIRIFNFNGVKHGTITSRINDEENFEVTTLRLDVRCDGRHAEVEFTTDWLLDANRRDLTINSMFLGFDGKVYDYFFGYEDLQNRRVVFVGDPSNRIIEDYLRILRYFRFYGRISENMDGFDPKTIEAICANIDGLQKISGERIWGELKKILQGNFRFDIFAKLIECGAARYIGFPAMVDCNDLLFLKQTAETTFKDVQMNPITMVSTLLTTREDAMTLHSRLKLSAFERDMAFFLVENKAETRNVDDLLYYQKMCLPQKNRSFNLLKDFVLELLKYNDKREIYDQIIGWQMPKFPITGALLTEHGYNGRKVGAIQSKLRDIWADTNFQITREELMQHHLAQAQQEVAEEESQRKKKKTNK